MHEEKQALMSRGVLYLASGSAYREKAIRSAKSVKRHNPTLPITIYTDEPVDTPVFDKVRALDEPITEPGDSILTDRHFPYDQNLYLDADTYVCDDITDLFTLLDEFDLGLAHNVGRAYWRPDIYESNEIDIPEAFTEYNSGVMAYTSGDTVRELFAEWGDLYRSMDFETSRWNQQALRMALYQSEVSLATLPPEYNFMMHSVGYVTGYVKILHQGISGLDPAEFADLLNSTTEKRVITWEEEPFRLVPDSAKSPRNLGRHYLAQARKTLREDGVLALAKATFQQIRS